MSYWLWALVVVIIIVVVVVLVDRNHNKNTLASLSQTQLTQQQDQIKANWATFFGSSTSLATRESLLQNGSQFSQVMQGEFAQLGQESFSSTINSVTLTSLTAANVNYNVTLGGQTVLKNEKGTAVKVNGTWQVSDTSLCQLLGLGGSTPAVCKS